MSIVDFISVDVSSAGRHHDGTVFKESEFGKVSVARMLNIPEMKQIKNGTELSFVGDEAFQLTDMIRQEDRWVLM